MKKTERIIYEVDPHNRLVVSRPGLSPAKFRTVVDGTFRIEKSGLSYHVMKPQGNTIPQKINLSGNWSLDADHNLAFTFDKWNSGCYGNKLTIKGEVISAKEGSVSFSAATRDAGGKARIYVLTFEGAWRARKDNNIVFKVQRSAGSSDELVFCGGWQIKNNQILYTYTKRDLKRGLKSEHSFILTGYWQISEKNRLVYVVNKRIGSELEFAVSLAEPVPRGLRYEIGIGVTPAKKVVKLFGSWKINDSLGVIFEIPYEDGKVRSIFFGAAMRICGGMIELSLKDRKGRDLEIRGRFSRRIFDGQGEAYAEALASGGEIGVVAGMGFRW